MKDLTLSCQSCSNQFVVSADEQLYLKDTKQPLPIYCPICASIKSLEAQHPPKSQKDPAVRGL